MLVGGRYKTSDEVSRGGMSEVHFGQDEHLDRPVVLKCLQPSQEQRRIVDEQKALRQVISKHVVRLLDVVTHEVSGKAQTFLVIEHIDGDDLKENQFNYGKTYLTTIWQIASGLEDIHAAGVIHRDIKPGNARVDSEGVVKLFDFGLARQDGLDGKTVGIVGTLAYMAPELFASGTVCFSTSADVYAFGVSALTLLNKQQPNWCSQRPPRLAPNNAVGLHAPELPETIKDVLQACLSENPLLRPQMRDVKKAIEDTILFDQHSAQLILGPHIIDINKDNRNSSPSVTKGSAKDIISGLKISYDGFDFLVTKNIGGVSVNNTIVAEGFVLTPSCVIEFPSSGRSHYATFNVSQPEVFV
ncbi:MAG: serine/threonine protein kinase [Robiginitomaculum sp.]|nr:MAG: serine/threonine protein kinase [Robiginitomaculum sp.]